MKKLMVMIPVLVMAVFCISCGKNVEETPTGAFYEINPSSTTVASAAKFLENELNKDYPGLKIISVEKAEAQIVAGTNYRIFCVYSYEGKEKNLMAVIYENLDGVKKVTDLKMDED